MKRRSFITSSILAYGGLETFLNHDIHAGNPMDLNEELNTDQPAILLKTLENDNLIVKIYSNGVFEMVDRKNQITWDTWPVAIQDKGQVEEGHVWMRTGRSQTEQYPGHFRAELTGENFQYTLIARQQKIVGTFLCQVKLEGPWLVFKVLNVDDTIPSLVFPPPVKSEAIVIPKGVGEIIRDAEERFIYPRNIYPFYTRLNMRWLGGLKGEGGWIGIFDEGFEDAYGFVANRTASPMWIRSLGQWSHPYTYRLKFVKGDYVQLAKTYREWTIQQGGFVSLIDKMKTNPQLDSFLGGRAFWLNLAFPSVPEKTVEDFLLTDEQKLRRGVNPLQLLNTYQQAAAKIDHLKQSGLKKGFIKIAGWINGGYDYSHQDTWPPEPMLGPVSELKDLLGMEGDLICGLHDNNQDIYPHTSSFPQGVIRNADGELLTGGVWAGGQAYILGSRASVKYARRNWENISTLKPKAMFVDIITAMQLYQSFENNNTLTKGQDLEAKKELMKFYKDQGILLGSEESADFGISYLDWYENRHQRVSGVSIPLWPLVFHDAAFSTRYGGVTSVDGYPGWLVDMLWGYLPHFSINEDWKYDDLFKSISHVDAWHERIGMAEMVDHRFLTEDFKVEQTSFSTGDSIICNFGDQSTHIDGTTIEPGGYITRS
jgi:hypothetical protein